MFGMRGLNPIQYARYVKMSGKLDTHIKKRCGYCNEMEMGFGNEILVADFIKHLVENHPEKIDAKEIEDYNYFIKKLNT